MKDGRLGVGVAEEVGDTLVSGVCPVTLDVGFGLRIASVLVTVAAYDGGGCGAYTDHSKEKMGGAVVELEEFEHRFVLFVSDCELVVQVFGLVP